MDKKYNDIYEKLVKVQWLLNRYQMKNHAHGGPFADPSRGQGRVLAILKLQDEISTKDLSYLLGIRRQSLNELLNKLEKAELITRTPLESDKRINMVKLTEQGLAKAAERETNKDRENTNLSEVFDCLSDDEQISLDDYLDRIIGALQENLGTDEDEDWSKWMNNARCRMGEEKFDMLMSMHNARRRGGHHGHRHEFVPRDVRERYPHHEHKYEYEYELGFDMRMPE